MKWTTTKVATLILALVIVFLGIFYIGDDVGLGESATTDYIQFVPGLFVTIIGIGVTWGVRGTINLASMAITGIGFAILLGDMESAGYITSELLAGLTIDQLQIWTIVIASLAGGIIVASNR